MFQISWERSQVKNPTKSATRPDKLLENFRWFSEAHIYWPVAIPHWHLAFKTYLEPSNWMFNLIVNALIWVWAFIVSKEVFWSTLLTDTATSFKSKRDAKKKGLSSHDHNWNTLFLGMNAVADVMAEQYDTTKGTILDDATSSSLAVRMALGETQIVTETRKFLVSQGVKLDVFGQVSFVPKIFWLADV